MTIFLEKYALPLLAGLTGALILAILVPTNLTWPQKIVCIVILGTFAVAIALEITRRNKKRALSSETTVKDSRIFVSLKPSELMDFYNSHTNIQADKLAAPYTDKWMNVSGKVRNITPSSEKEVLVALREDSFGPNETRALLLYFSRNPWVQHLEILSVGYHITANGQIGSIDNHGLILRNCELLETARK
jgi:uncharacterized membrane protein